MAREIQRTTIGGHDYAMTLLPATRSYKLFHRLFKMFGPSFGQLMDAVAGVKSVVDLDLSGDAVNKVIQSVTSNVSEHDLEHVISILKDETTVAISGSGKDIPLKGVFEAHFQGDVAGMFRWLYWGLGVQYRSFFEGLGSITSRNVVVQSSGEHKAKA